MWHESCGAEQESQILFEEVFNVSVLTCNQPMTLVISRPIRFYISAKLMVMLTSTVLSASFSSRWKWRSWKPTNVIKTRAPSFQKLIQCHERRRRFKYVKNHRFEAKLIIAHHLLGGFRAVGVDLRSGHAHCTLHSVQILSSDWWRRRSGLDTQKHGHWSSAPQTNGEKQTKYRNCLEIKRSWKRRLQWPALHTRTVRDEST